MKGGESLNAFAARVRGALAQIAQECAGRSALVVAHAGVLDIAWRLAMGKRLDETRRDPVLNAAPNWIAHDEGHWSIVDWARELGRASVAAPWDGLKLARRQAARVLIRDERGRVGLFSYSSRLAPHFLALGRERFWTPPGGALEAGETYEKAARRELFEETGVADVDLSDVVATREYPMQLGEQWVQSVERYFCVAAPLFTPRPQSFTESETAHVRGWKWWSRQEIAASNELIFPEGLDALLERLDDA